MPDEANQAPDEVQDTPPEAPAEAQDTPAEVVDYRKRYTDLRPDYDRKSQRLSEVEEILSDPERLAAYWQEQGFGDEEDGETFQEEPADPYLEHIQRLEAEVGKLTEAQKAQEVQAQKTAEHEFVADSLAEIENKLSQELPQKVANWIGNVALQNRDEQGRPDVESAFKEWQEVVDAERENWVKTKKVKSRPGTGAAAVEQVDKSTRKGRVDYLTQRMSELEA